MTLRNIQALRAIAALLVVSVHIGNPQGFESRLTAHPLLGHISDVGYAGVDVFFIISGIIMVIVTQGHGGLADAGSFLRRRVARIYPPVWIVDSLVLIVYLIAPDRVDSHSPVRPDLVASFLLLPQAGSPLVLVTWTLVFEMYFYLIFTLAVAAGKRRCFAVLAAWGAVTAILAATIHGPSNVYLALVANPLSLEFLIGVAVGILTVRRRFVAPKLAIVVGIALTIVTFAAPWHGLRGPNAGWIRVAEAVPLAAIAYGLIGVEIRDGLRLPRFMDRIGDASYAIYLWHIPIISAIAIVLERFRPLSPGADAVAVIAAYAAVIAFALAIFRFVEKPLTAYLIGPRR